MTFFSTFSGSEKVSDAIGDLSFVIGSGLFQPTGVVLPAAPVIGTVESAPIVEPTNPVLVPSASAVDVGEEIDLAPEGVPQTPPVFFPTLLNGQTIKSVGNELNVLDETANVAETFAAAPIADVGGKISNVDLGLIAVGGAAILTTGIFALIGR